MWLMAKKKKGHGKRHHGGGHTHRIHNPDWKILLFGAAVGAVGIIGSAYLTAKVTFLTQYWYALPVGFAAVGALLLKRMPLVGIGLAVMAGALLYTNYYAFGPGTGNTKSAGVRGWNDAGAFGVRRDAGMFDRPGAALPALPRHDAGAALPGVRGSSHFQDAGWLAGV
jgi:hypothetical protein